MPSNATGDAPADLALVGTIHLDPRLPERLARLLEGIRPDLVTVEVSPFAVQFRERNAERLIALLERRAREIIGTAPFADPRVDAIRRQIELPAEWVAARRYAQTRGIPVRAVDLSAYSRALLPLIESELIAQENLRLVLAGPILDPAAEVAARYARVRRRLTDGTRLLAPEIADARHRDAHIAPRIRREIVRHGARRAVHLCGAEHLLLYPGCLRERLADLRLSLRLADEGEGT